MNTTAYDKNLPCLNPNCKSHGRPHPNCRCYGFSDGGEVAHFCSESREHKPDCEYYADGGGVEASSEGFVPQEEASSEGFQPAGEEASSEGFTPEDDSLETAKAFGEGASQGVLGPFAPMLEEGLGISTKENIARRQQEHPIAHGLGEATTLVGGMLAGTGEAGLIAKGAEAVSEAANLGKVGSGVLKSAIAASSFATSDEMTKSFLGIPGSDPEHPVSAALMNVGAAALTGGLSGGAFSLGEGLIGQGIESEAGTKMASKGQEFLFKLAQSPDPLKSLGVSATLSAYPAYETSKKIEEKTGVPLWITLPQIEAIYTAGGQKVISRLNPYVTSAVVKALSENEPSGIPNAVQIAIHAGNGLKKTADAIGTVMGTKLGPVAEPTIQKAKEQLKKFIEGGQVGKQMKNSMSEQGLQQNFAEGGEVQPEPTSAFAKVFPTQNTLLNAAKGRISNYLNGLRPLNNQIKKPFDDELPNKEQERQYDKAIDFAVNPMTILDHVNQGDLTPEHMKHFTSLYPEVHRFLSKEMTKQITESQLNDEKPPYGKRQAMSLFLGADLDSSFSPQAIQTIQGLYAQKQQAQQQQVPQKPKKGTATLSKGPNSYLTGDQAREKRQQDAKA